MKPMDEDLYVLLLAGGLMGIVLIPLLMVKLVLQYRADKLKREIAEWESREFWDI